MKGCRCVTGSASADCQLTPHLYLHWRSQWHTLFNELSGPATVQCFLLLKTEVAMWNIIIGLVFVVGGLSGQLALRGFDSPEGLAAFGGILIVWGIVQTVRAKNAE
ncbi:MAG: hypothetical protein ACI8P0_003886 [Planctomycetaceae bacterium]|jgi:hypothetical protein